MSVKAKIYELGIISKIAHSIAHNTYIDQGFDANRYISMCIDVMDDVGLDQELVQNMVKEIMQQAKEDFVTVSVMGLPLTSSGGSSIHPAVLIGMDAVRLHEEIAASKENK